MSNKDYENVPVVLLAAGEARRLQPISQQIIKPIVPIVGIPIINRIIKNYFENGFRKFLIVISNEEKGIKATISEMEIYKQDRISVEYHIQEKQLGMADAILKTENALKKKLDKYNFFFVSAIDVLFDEITPKLMIEAHIESHADITLSIISSNDKNMGIGHGNVSLNNKKEITEIVEKPGPDNIIDNFYSMPIYIFPIELMDYIRKTKISKRGELEVQGAIQLMIKDEKEIIGVNVLPNITDFSLADIGAYHLTYAKDVLQMNFRFLKEGDFNFEGEYPTTIEPVNSEDKVICGDSVLLGPNVYFGTGCELKNLVEISSSLLLGKNKIGNGTIIDNVILGKRVKIEPSQKIKDKIILFDDKKKENMIFDL